MLRHQCFTGMFTKVFRETRFLMMSKKPNDKERDIHTKLREDKISYYNKL